IPLRESANNLALAPWSLCVQKTPGNFRLAISPELSVMSESVITPICVTAGATRLGGRPRAKRGVTFTASRRDKRARSCRINVEERRTSAGAAQVVAWQVLSYL